MTWKITVANSGRISTKESLCFLAAVVLLALKFIYLIVQHRLVIQDAFFCFCYQYYFLNHAAVYGETPQWIPYIAHGVTALYYASVHGCKGIFFNALMLFAGTVRQVNFLPLFYLNIFIDEFLLLVGVWLLARRYAFSAVTIFFVSVAVLGSMLWMSQFCFSLYVSFALPLILYLFHRFLDTGRWRYFFLSTNLFAIQSLNNPPYFLPLTSLVIFLYFFFYALVNIPEMRIKLSRLKFGWEFIFCLAGVVASGFCLYWLYLLSQDPQNLINYHLRNADGSTTLDTFLKYGGQPGLARWLEVFLGFSPHQDYSIYFGILPLAMALYGILTCVSRKTFPLLAVMAVLFFMSTGSVVATFFYHTWPFMSFYRHLFYLVGLIKVLLAFFSGFGFQRLIDGEIQGRRGKYGRYALYLVILVLSAASYYTLVISTDTRMVKAFIDFMNFDTTGLALRWYSIVAGALFANSLNSLMILLLLIAFCLPGIKPHGRTLLVILILLVHILNIKAYYIFEAKNRTVKLNARQTEILSFQRLPYRERRAQSLSVQDNPRLALINGPAKQLISEYVISNALLFNDEIDNPLNIRHWQKPLDDFIRAYAGAPLRADNYGPLMLQDHSLIIPKGHAAARKFAGLDEKKIQFFSRGYYLEDRKTIAQYLASPYYKGDILIVSLPEDNTAIDLPKYKSLAPGLLRQNERLVLPYKVADFNSNRIKIQVENPLPIKIWIFYSDVWHPRWQATVNGQAAKVFNANLAYKAVMLPSGKSEVVFEFSCPDLVWLLRIFGINSLFWLGFIFYAGYKIATRPEADIL